MAAAGPNVLVAVPAPGAAGPPAASDPALWASVDRIVDRAPDLAALRAHNLQLVAARRWRSLGRPVPRDLVAEARWAALASLTVPMLLAKVRAGCDGPLVLFKGPEIAARYPDAALRGFRDIDLLVPNARRTQRQLVAAGFCEVGDEELYRDIHHLRPLAWPGLPLVVEIHERPKWIDDAAPPPTAELVAAAVPARVGVEGISALPAAQHALLLAAHSWAHEPLRRLRDLVDVAAAAREARSDEIRALAQAWGLAGLWRTTDAMVGAILYGARTPVAAHVWARNVHAVRERNVLERHLERWLSPFSSLSGRRAVAASARAVAVDLRPDGDESWTVKLARTRRALRAPFVAQSHHHGALAAPDEESR